jgi:hypothetical protein
MGMVLASLSNTARRRVARSDPAATSGTRPFPPLPPTLVLEGAAQPFLLEMVESQSSTGRRPGRGVMAPTGYNEGIANGLPGHR